MHGLTCTICCPMSHPSLSIAWDQAWKPHGANNLNTSYDSFLESLDFASWTVRSAQKDTHSFVMRCCLNSESLPFMFKQCIFQLEKQLSVWRKTWHTVIPQISVLLTSKQTSTPGIFMLGFHGLPRYVDTVFGGAGFVLRAAKDAPTKIAWGKEFWGLPGRDVV